MKNFIVLLMLLAFIPGCGNLSPRDNLNPKLDVNNQQGRIERLENNQNAIRAEIERLSLFSRENNNNGIQILQGDGGLILVFGLGTIFLVLFYFYKIAEEERKTAEILAQQIVNSNDIELEENVMKAAQHTNVERNICSLISKERTKMQMKKKS